MLELTYWVGPDPKIRLPHLPDINVILMSDRFGYPKRGKLYFFFSASLVSHLFANQLFLIPINSQTMNNLTKVDPFFLV